MVRNKTPIDFQRCGHESPVLVKPVEGGMKVARCLRCGQTSPAIREGAEEALQTLRAQARSRDPRSA